MRIVQKKEVLTAVGVNDGVIEDLVMRAAHRKSDALLVPIAGVPAYFDICQCQCPQTAQMVWTNERNAISAQQPMCCG